jgi:hypothetical protein
MKEGSLFCFVVMRSTEPGCFRSCSDGCVWKALDEEGVHGLDSMMMMFGMCFWVLVVKRILMSRKLMKFIW